MTDAAEAKPQPPAVFEMANKFGPIGDGPVLAHPSSVALIATGAIHFARMINLLGMSSMTQ